MIKERPILYSTPMVKAVLEGRKTQTRRIIKPQPEACFNDGTWYADRYNHTDNWCFWGKRDTEVHNKCGLPFFHCPYGKVGDRLWCKETFYVAPGIYCSDSPSPVLYKADGNIPDGFIQHPSIFMPRWASRINLEITDIRVQRLQEITEEDAKDEGVCFHDDNAVPTYAELWDSINGKGAWNMNPWVWCLSFKKVE